MRLTDMNSLALDGFIAAKSDFDIAAPLLVPLWVGSPADGTVSFGAVCTDGYSGSFRSATKNWM